MIIPYTDTFLYDLKAYDEDVHKERFSDLDICYTEPIIISDTDSSITVTTDHFNPYVILDLPCVMSDNCFALKANEVKTIRKLKFGDVKN